MTYKEYFSSMIRVAIDKEDQVMVKTLMEQIYPLMSDLDKDISSYVFEDAFEKENVEIAKSIIDNIRMTDNFCLAAINSMLRKNSGPTETLKVVFENIGDKYGIAMFNAIKHTNIDVIRSLVEHNGLKPVSVTSYNYRTFIDGISIRPQAIPKQPIKRESIKELMEIGAKCGFSDLLWLTENDLTYDIFDRDSSIFRASKPDPYPHPLPMLKGGVLSHPELALAFAKAETLAPRLLKRVPFWISDDFTDFPEASIFERKDGLSCARDRGEGFVEVPPSEISEKRTIFRHLGEFSNNYHYNLYVDLGYYPVSGENLDQDTILASMIMPEHVSHGFAAPKGYRLAVANVEDLLDFDISVFDQRVLAETKEYADNFYPINYLRATHPHALESDYNVDPIGIVKGDSIDLFYALMGDPVLEKCILDKYPDKRFWANMLLNSRKSPDRMIKAYSMGIPSEDYISNHDLFSTEQLVELKEAGFLFQSEDPLFRIRTRDSDGEELCLEMGGWPHKEEIEGIYESIKKCIRLSNPVVYSDYLKYKANPEEIFRQCKTEKQWSAMLELLGPEKTRPYLNMAPKTLRRRVLTEDLGM